MDDATPGPQRMHYAFETRCWAVAAMVAGLSPGVAAQAVGASRHARRPAGASRRDRGQGAAAAGALTLPARPTAPGHAL